SLTPLLVEKYLAAADKIVARAFESRDCRKRLGLLFRPGERPSPERLRKVVENFARRAYRRPVTEAEVTRLLRFVDLAEKQGDGWEKGLQLTFQAVLVSPNFLFRVEQEPDRDAPNGVRRLNDFELASRLSYFLWSTMPDEELFALAGKGELRQGDNLERQVRRMLKDPKAHAFVENFAGQWLQLRNLKTAAPDPGTYPAFDDSLRAAMQKETELFFEAVLKEDRSILDFLDADFTFVNERLARHYGIAGVKGNEFRRVQLPDRRRGGVLTQASVLTVTSNPTRTSPVKRGKFIMENILGTPPPPPAPDAGELKEGGELKGTLRQRMEQHRANPNCAVCHQKMDPLGFGFENFDGIGSWRTKEGKFDIDPSGVLPGGEKFNGPAELKAVLKKMDGQFRRCLTEKMLTYALGRGLEYYDKCVVDDISAQVAKDNNKLSRLVIEVVRSDPFQMRRRYKGGR
ncbi:MAG TPA: DUF1592 domain-containing protein, partial [Gemmataceae bacterium]|nr:DUF1592 domain-containing protein [Gemmataceae bacterium]